MKARARTWSAICIGILCLMLATAACAQVNVTIDGDTAYASIALTDNNGVTYTADVTIEFDSPQNLSAQSLNLTAELIDPAAIQTRLPGGDTPCLPLVCTCPGLVCPPPMVDPAFPVMVTVEPQVFPWLFVSSFDGNEDGSGDLSFKNTYQFEMHTHDLAYTDGTLYRLFKAPVGGEFDDVTTDVLQGSMRARGRGGAFSQFIIVSDPRDQTRLAQAKLGQLQTRILLAALSDGLQLDLLGLVAKVEALLLVDLLGAVDVLDQLLALIDLDAGTDIANVWTASHNVANDAGEMSALGETARFSMTRTTGTANP